MLNALRLLAPEDSDGVGGRLIVVVVVVVGVTNNLSNKNRNNMRDGQHWVQERQPTTYAHAS